jgi:hypothetical protein
MTAGMSAFSITWAMSIIGANSLHGILSDKQSKCPSKPRASDAGRFTFVTVLARGANRPRVLARLSRHSVRCV